MDVIVTVFHVALAVVGAAALLTQLVVRLTDMRPDSRVHKRAGAVARVLQTVLDWLDKLALNLDKGDARGKVVDRGGSAGTAGDVDHSKSGGQAPW